MYRPYECFGEKRGSEVSRQRGCGTICIHDSNVAEQRDCVLIVFMLGGQQQHGIRGQQGIRATSACTLD